MSHFRMGDYPPTGLTGTACHYPNRELKDKVKVTVFLNGNANISMNVVCLRHACQATEFEVVCVCVFRVRVCVCACVRITAHV